MPFFSMQGDEREKHVTDIAYFQEQGNKERKEQIEY